MPIVQQKKGQPRGADQLSTAVPRLSTFGSRTPALLLILDAAKVVRFSEMAKKLGKKFWFLTKKQSVSYIYGIRKLKFPTFLKSPLHN